MALQEQKLACVTAAMWRKGTARQLLVRRVLPGNGAIVTAHRRRTVKRWKVMLCTDFTRCASQMHRWWPCGATWNEPDLSRLYRSTCNSMQ